MLFAPLFYYTTGQSLLFCVFSLSLAFPLISNLIFSEADYNKEKFQVFKYFDKSIKTSTYLMKMKIDYLYFHLVDEFSYYCMSKKSCLYLYSESLNGQDFFDIKYTKYWNKNLAGMFCICLWKIKITIFLWNCTLNFNLFWMHDNLTV